MAVGSTMEEKTIDPTIVWKEKRKKRRRRFKRPMPPSYVVQATLACTHGFIDLYSVVHIMQGCSKYLKVDRCKAEGVLFCCSLDVLVVQ